MTIAPVERRRITLLGDAGSVDLAVPAGDRLDDALRRSGIALDPRTQFVVDRNGYQVDPSTAGGELDDGGLYVVVTVAGERPGTRRTRGDQQSRTDHGARWILLALVPVLAAVVIALVADDVVARVAVAVVLGVASVAPAIAWALRSERPNAAPPIAMAAPLALSAVAMAAAVPGDLDSAVHLRIAVGLLAPAVLALVLAVCTAEVALRAAWATIAVLLLVLAGIWGGSLLAHLTIPASAAVSLGLVPVVLRALPSTLVNVPDGTFIDYRHFMSNRWSVRGAIPDSPASIAMSDAERVVRASSARLTAGTLLLSLVACAAAPLAAQGLVGAEPLSAIGSIALFACVVLSLLLTPRHTTGQVLRWLPRAAAVVVLLVGVAAVAAEIGPIAGLLGGAIGFVVAVIAALASIPLGRGGTSLVWSRVGDVVEWIAVVLALPAALLAANSIELMRGMMAG